MTNTTTIPDNSLGLRKHLLKELERLSNNEITPDRANAAAAVGLAALRLVTKDVEYQLQRGEKPFTTFFVKEPEPQSA